jgi:hypothetical protein
MPPIVLKCSGARSRARRTFITSTASVAFSTLVL